MSVIEREAILKAAMEAGCDEAERLGYGSELGYAEAASIGEKAATVALDQLQRAVERADAAEMELRKFQAGLTDVLRVYNVPAMPSWREAIHWLARHGGVLGVPHGTVEGRVHVDALHEALGGLSNDIDGYLDVADVIAAVHNARGQ